MVGGKGIKGEEEEERRKGGREGGRERNLRDVWSGGPNSYDIIYPLHWQSIQTSNYRGMQHSKAFCVFDRGIG